MKENNPLQLILRGIFYVPEGSIVGNEGGCVVFGRVEFSNIGLYQKKNSNFAPFLIETSS